VGVLGRLVGALGDRGEHNPLRLAQVEQGRADQVAHVFDHHHGAYGRVERAKRLTDHGRIQVAARAGVHLDDLAASRPDAVGVQQGLLVTLDDAECEFGSKVAGGALQQRGFARSGGAHHVHGQNAPLAQPGTIVLGEFVVLGEHLLL